MSVIVCLSPSLSTFRDVPACPPYLQSALLSVAQLPLGCTLFRSKLLRRWVVDAILVLLAAAAAAAAAPAFLRSECQKGFPDRVAHPALIRRRATLVIVDWPLSTIMCSAAAESTSGLYNSVGGKKKEEEKGQGLFRENEKRDSCWTLRCRRRRLQTPR